MALCNCDGLECAVRKSIEFDSIWRLSRSAVQLTSPLNPSKNLLATCCDRTIEQQRTCPIASAKRTATSKIIGGLQPAKK
ncbi:MAG: hypothetical protein WBA89_09630 [Microcoleus sp.]|uniref:hypothetical protein n=1 Tax=Microcoleus sp. TaxID=44472 RepID=UPI003C72E0B7